MTNNLNEINVRNTPLKSRTVSKHISSSVANQTSFNNEINSRELSYKLNIYNTERRMSTPIEKSANIAKDSVEVLNLKNQALMQNGAYQISQKIKV